MRWRPLPLAWLLGALCALPSVCAARERQTPPAREKRAAKVTPPRASGARAQVKKAASPKVRQAAVRGTPRGRRVARRAAGLVGTSLAAQPVPDDCSGLVRLAYQYVGVELLSHGLRPGENASSAIYRRAQRAGALHRRTPRPGDVVFFRETYDRNGDGVRNDGVTHVGVVESVERDGTAVFVHRGSGGVSRSRLNPRVAARRAKGGRVVNDYLRRAEDGQPARLTHELFVGYASAARL